MHAIILHEIGLKTSDIKKGLAYHNFKVECHPIGREYDRSKLFDTEALILLIDSSKIATHPEKIAKDFARARARMALIIIDSIYSEETAAKARALGFDHYTARPIHIGALALKAKSIICKKHALHGNQWLRAFDVKLDMEHRLVKRRTACVKLSNKEFDLLEFFIMNRGKLLTRTSIFEHVWDRNACFSSNTIDVHVNRLRKKIDDPFQKKLIHTSHGIGYIFDLNPAM